MIMVSLPTCALHKTFDTMRYHPFCSFFLFAVALNKYDASKYTVVLYSDHWIKVLLDFTRRAVLLHVFYRMV